MIFKFLACFSFRKINMKFLLASLKTFTDSEKLLKAQAAIRKPDKLSEEGYWKEFHNR
jgi:hypothetical protein